MSNHVFMLWTGNNPLSENRLRSIKVTEQNIGCPVRLIDDKILHEKILAEIGIKLHPAYYCLNHAHRADYLRALLMHFIGGGYSDIKVNRSSWGSCFRELADSSSHFGVSYREVSKNGVANLYSSAIVMHKRKLEHIRSLVKYRLMRKRYKRLIGCGAFIFKPNTEFTRLWWGNVNSRLDSLHDALQANPARLHAKEQPGKSYCGIRSQYPVPWTYLLGDIFHPLCLKHSRSLLQTLPAPSFVDYE